MEKYFAIPISESDLKEIVKQLAFARENTSYRMDNSQLFHQHVGIEERFEQILKDFSNEQD